MNTSATLKTTIIRDEAPPLSIAEEDPRQALAKLIDASSDKHFVFLFGTPASGKTTVLGSIIQSMQRKGVEGKFFVHGSGDGYFANGLALWNSIRENFGEKRFPPRSAIGSTIQLHAEYVPLGTPPGKEGLQFIFLEMSGEDLRQVKITQNGTRSLPIHINNFLKVPDLKLSFLITTKWSDAKKDDNAIDDFLSFIQQTAPHLHANRFLLLVTQWDAKRNKDEQIDTFVQREMPQTYSKLAAARNVIQPFSVGSVVPYDGEGGDLIASFDYPAGQRLFARIYETFTGIDSEKPPMPKKNPWIFWK